MPLALTYVCLSSSELGVHRLYILLLRPQNSDGQCAPVSDLKNPNFRLFAVEYRG